MRAVALMCCLVAVALASPMPQGGDSLRGALEALDRRQRALQQRPTAYLSNGASAGRFRYPSARQRDVEQEEQDEDGIEFLPMEPGQPEDIGYGYQRGGGVAQLQQQQQHHEPHATPAQLERLLLDYLQGDESSEDGQGGEDERWSPFRERDTEPQEVEVKRAPPSSLFRERQRQDKRAAPGPGDERYMQLLAALWDKYQRELDQQQEAEESIEKRQYGYGDGYDYYNSPMGWGDGHFNGYKRGGAAENDPWFPAFELVPRDRDQLVSAPAKRFPVAKRSSGVGPPPTHHKKVGAKVAADLAQIFEDKKSNATSNSSTEAPTTVTTGTPHPAAAMHKKSVDWSDYFGIDRRRKKSAPPTVEGGEGESPEEEEAQRETERRIMEQYYRTLALATSVKRKRSSSSSSEGVEEPAGAPASLESMDKKLRTMEDLIVDEAVKFTGAHQGSADPKEIQTVKDQVLSRLAAAYSLEKMRQALDEFRASLGHGEQQQEAIAAAQVAPRADKRANHECPELRALLNSCSRVQQAFAEPCTWHHACRLCSAPGEGEACDVGFLHASQQVCEGHAACLRGAHRLLGAIARSDGGLGERGGRCEPCVRRFLEARRR